MWKKPVVSPYAGIASGARMARSGSERVGVREGVCE
jgi:hypothetical protein